MDKYRQQKRRDRHKNNRTVKTSRNTGKSVIIEMDAYYDSAGMVPRVVVIESDDKNKNNGYLYGLPIEIFGFKYEQGTRFRITCEPIYNPKSKPFKNPLKPSSPPFRVDPNDDDFDEYS